MQQFTVPQFIEVESKIIGPITTRQFLILLGAAMIIFLNYKLFDFSLFVVTSVLVFSLAATFAFVKVNSRPFHFFVLNLIQTWRRPGLRVWNHRATDFMEKEKTEIKFEHTEINKQLNAARLAELSLVVDTQGRYRGSENNSPENLRNVSESK